MNTTKIFTLLAGLTLACAPLFAQAYQIAPNPNPLGSTITVYTSDAENLSSFENNGSLIIGMYDSVGTLNNSGTLNNNADLLIQGTLNNNFGGTINNSGSILSPGGHSSINNNFGGTINNNFGGTLDVYVTNLYNNTGATLNNNFGSILKSDAVLSNSGTLNNSGAIFMNDSSALVNLSGGTVNLNSGSTLVLLNPMVNQSGGTVNINSGGTLNVGRAGAGHYSAQLNNSGNLNNASILNFSDFASSHNSGTLNNSGTLSLTDSHTSYSGYSSFYNSAILNNTGILHNSAVLNNTGTIAGSGAYIQNAGQTINNGTMTQSSFDVQGGSLSGTGTMNGNVSIGSLASVNPGNSPGIMTINGDFNSSGTLLFDIAGLGTGLYDVLSINGNVLFTGGNIQFDFINGFNTTAGNYWDFLTANTVTGWDTLNFNFNGLRNGLGWNFTKLDTGGERLWINSIAVSPVPEPETYAMLLAGLGLIGFTAFLRKQTFAA
jgi:PEP-CTERM motif